MSATQKGVENPRRAALADIVKGRTENLAEEIKQAGGDVAELGLPADNGEVDPRKPADISAEAWSAMSDEEKGNAIASAEAEKKEDKPAEEPAVEVEAQPAEEPAARKFKGKVDGKEVEFEEQAVIDAGLRALQKESAADKRLEEATRIQQEAERLRLNVEATLRQVQPAQDKRTDQEMLVAKDGLRDIVKKIQYGSEEEAAEALAEYGSRMAKMGQTQSLTQAELNNILDLREAQQFVKTNYADVLGDENLKDLFVSKVNKKLAAGDQRTYQEICKETGDELRQWRAPAPQPTPAPAAGGSRAAAAERKAKVVVIPAAQARQPAPTPQPAPSSSDVIAKMKEARGQA